MVSGRCECGKVCFSVESVSPAVTVCHCSQCRRTSGHIWASADTLSFDALRFSADEGLTWYASSSFAKRGFCRFCGSALFYQVNGEQRVSIGAGCLDAPTGALIDKHIFVADKGDYYEITDGKPQFAQDG